MLIADDVTAMKHKIINTIVLPAVHIAVACDVSAVYCQSHDNTTVVCQIGWVSRNVIDRGNFGLTALDIKCASGSCQALLCIS